MGKAAKPAVRVRPGEKAAVLVFGDVLSLETVFVPVSPGEKREADPLPCTGACGYASCSYIGVYKTQKIQTLIGLLFYYL